jgi:hypothetical protein
MFRAFAGDIVPVGLIVCGDVVEADITRALGLSLSVLDAASVNLNCIRYFLPFASAMLSASA